MKEIKHDTSKKRVYTVTDVVVYKTTNRLYSIVRIVGDKLEIKTLNKAGGGKQFEVEHEQITRLHVQVADTISYSGNGYTVLEIMSVKNSKTDKYETVLKAAKLGGGQETFLQYTDKIEHYEPPF